MYVELHARLQVPLNNEYVHWSPVLDKEFAHHSSKASSTFRPKYTGQADKFRARAHTHRFKKLKSLNWFILNGSI